VDANEGRRAVGLVTLDTVDVDDPALAVDLGDLALAALVFAADDADFVVFADGERAGLFIGSVMRRGWDTVTTHVVLSAQLL
jgi:hypothetical protein